MSAQTVAGRWVRDWTSTVDCGSTTGRPIRCPRSDDQEGEGARTATVEEGSGDHQHARVENAFFRYTSIVGDCLRARSSSGQRREAVLACNVLNRMTELGRPVSYRIGR